MEQKIKLVFKTKRVDFIVEKTLNPYKLLYIKFTFFANYVEGGM